MLHRDDWFPTFPVHFCSIFGTYRRYFFNDPVIPELRILAAGRRLNNILRTCWPFVSLGWRRYQRTSIPSTNSTNLTDSWENKCLRNCKSCAWLWLLCWTIGNHGNFKNDDYIFYQKQNIFDISKFGLSLEEKILAVDRLVEQVKDKANWIRAWYMRFRGSWIIRK